jgi:membrane fusion protein (multidrug efflux system)
MKTSTKVTSIVIIFFLIIATVIIGRTMIGNHFKKKFSKRPPPGIIITTTEERIFENIISTYGTAAPIQTQSFKIEKYEILNPINFNQKVKKGDVIANLKNRKIIAQFDGVIGKREFSEDLEVSKSSILVNLEDSSSIYCDVDIPEIFVPFIKVGLPVDIKFSGYKNKIYKGEIDSFASRISEDTRALTTRIKMDNMAGEILPGSFLEISIKYDIRDSLSAPDTSTIVEGENVYIYKVDEKNKVIKTKVTIGDRYLGFVEILDGLENGDKIVAEGTKKVRPNLIIRPIEKGSNKKQGNSSWGKKKESNNTGEKKSKFDWIKNIFKKSEKEKK